MLFCGAMKMVKLLCCPVAKGRQLPCVYPGCHASLAGAKAWCISLYPPCGRCCLSLWCRVQSSAQNCKGSKQARVPAVGMCTKDTCGKPTAQDMLLCKPIWVTNSPKRTWLPLNPPPIGGPTPCITAPKALGNLQWARMVLPK